MSIYKVTSVTPNLLNVEVIDVEAYDAQEESQKLSIGSYLKISDDKGLSILAIVQSFKIRDAAQAGGDAAPQQPAFSVEAQQIGCFDSTGAFKRGGQRIAIPPTNVTVATADELASIYAGIDEAKRLSFGALAQDESIRVFVDGDRFFGKHIGVVGSTGSGKSCTVAKLLQEGIRPSDAQNTGGILNNSHVIIFDIHGEYGPAFPKANVITVDTLSLPYWLMNSEELEEMFIESQEQNSHNQVSQFKLAVIENKRRHNPKIAKVTYDTPVYFSIDEVHRHIRNQNMATKDAKTGVLAIQERPDNVEDKHILFEEITFQDKAQGKINGGPYAGEFDRFVSRLETKLNDERLSFLLRPTKAGGEEYSTADLADLLKQFTGYRADSLSNVTIIDLSGVPFEALSLVVSLITRLVFDFCFYFRRLETKEREVPFLLVYEEAHRYVPRTEGSRYGSVKRSIERVAKEGRKYGVSLMIVSQRPSEISETIFSQCNNFVAMRLTNPADQQYIRRLLPDSVAAVTDALPVLEKREAIVIGDSISIPSIMCVDEITDKPNSNDIDFHTEWKQDWLAMQFEEVIAKLRKD